MSAKVRNITQKTLAKVWKNTELRLNYIIKAKGGHNENLL